jgi:hypothetical protein
MAKYETELEIPLYGDIDKFIESLRAFGHPKIVVRFETDPDMKSKRAIAHTVADELSSWWFDFYRFTEDWWMDNLKPIRGNRAKEDI